MELIFDIETNGLLDEVSTLHCITAIDMATGQKYLATDWPHVVAAPDVELIGVKDGLAMLSGASLLVGHNIIDYDLPVLRKLFPEWSTQALIRDTITCARVIWPKDILRDKDFTLHKKERIPGKLIGSYSLQAWGYRLCEYKGDYSGEWHTVNQDMLDYAVQDVVVTLSLWQLIAGKNYSEECLQLEHDVARIIHRQERYGFLVDQAKARALVGELEGVKYELEQKLFALVPPWEVHTTKIAGASNRTLGRVKGQPYTTVKVVEFNPGSRMHIAKVLADKYGWTPTEFTPDGKPKVDETVLDQLPYPEAKLLSEYFLVTKRLGQAGTGKESWVKAVKADGRIHGRVQTNGAVTGRMTHSTPNMAQVPGVKKDKEDNILYGRKGGWGYECRDLFTTASRKVLVGADAAALELRGLAGFMGDQSYIETVLNGSSKNGTDIHSVNAKALGCTRPQAKVWFYAFIYGAGDAKLGSILEAPVGEEMNWGRRSRARFMKNLPALGKLVKKVKDRVEGKAKNKDGSPAPRFLRGLDGRRLDCRSSHSALNTLLQSAGAIIMKRALVLLDNSLQAKGYVPGVNYEFVANIHDEWQIEADEALGEDIGKTAKESIRLAGEYYKFGCPLDGDFKVGKTWADTH